MAQSLRTLTESTAASPTIDSWERDQKAWNLPQASAAIVVPRAHDEPLEWEAFQAAHFPGGHRHNLKAIVAYGTYRRSFVSGSPQANSPLRTPD
jgi:hypothetical protein